MDVSPADLRDALALTPVLSRPGLYRGDLDGAWSYRLPSGGVLASLAIAAMRTELARRHIEGLVPTAATTTFCSAIAEGPLEIEVFVLRAGKTAAQLRAHLRPLSQLAAPGDVGLEVSATFSLPRALEDISDATWAPFPDELPPREACPDYDQTGITPPRFYRNLKLWRAAGEVWWQPSWPPSKPRVARYFAYRVPPLLPDGSLDPLALPPIADTMASAVHQGVGSKQPPMLFPSLDLTLHFVATTGLTTEPILVDARAHAVFAGVASASATLWQGRRLLMMATQTMTLRTLKGPREPAPPLAD